MRSGIGAIRRLQLPVPHDVLPVARDVAVAGDVTHQRGRCVELRVGEGILRREAGVLDPDREVVALHPVEPAVVAAVQRAVVQRGDVPRAVALRHELGDFASLFAHRVMRADLRDRIYEPAPAARVIAFAGVDDHQVDHAGRIGRPLVEVGRRSPYRGRVIRRSARRRRRTGARCSGGREARAGSGACERSINLARVCRPRFGELDAAIAGRDAGPGLDTRPVDAGLACVQVEQCGCGADVRHGIAARRLHRHARERRSPFQCRAPQGHDPERRRAPGEFLRPLYHLPARLRPADPRE